MSDLFGNTLSTLPKWLSPSEFSIASEQASASIGHNFTSAFNASANRELEKQQFKTKMDLASRELDLREKEGLARLNNYNLDNAIKSREFDWLNQDMGTMAEWMKDHPTVESRINAEPPQLFSQQGFNALSNTRAADSATVLGNTLKADQADFARRLALIPADDRSEILSMSNDPTTGLPTKMKWQALGMVEQRMAEQKRNFDLEKASLAPTIRAESAERTAEIRGKTAVQVAQERVNSWKEKPSSFFSDHAKMSAYNSRGKAITASTELSLDEKLKRLDALDNEFALGASAVPAAKPVTATAPTPEDDDESLPQPKTRAEYDALPPGTVYLHKDGTKRRK